MIYGGLVNPLIWLQSHCVVTISEIDRSELNWIELTTVGPSEALLALGVFESIGETHFIPMPTNVSQNIVYYWYDTHISNKLYLCVFILKE